MKAVGSEENVGRKAHPLYLADFPITHASVLDVVGVVRLEQICFGEDAWPLFDIIGLLSWPGEVRLKAMAGKRLIAFAAGETDENAGISQIATIGVDPEFRRRGIGEALLDACERALPGHKIQLTVRVDNLPAIHLYEKFGYHAYARLEDYYRHGKAGMAMEKVR
jgi:ribosomal protein S18 acetylase RimI-like enzyme